MVVRTTADYHDGKLTRRRRSAAGPGATSTDAAIKTTIKTTMEVIITTKIVPHYQCVLTRCTARMYWCHSKDLSTMYQSGGDHKTSNCLLMQRPES